MIKANSVRLPIVASKLEAHDWIHALFICVFSFFQAMVYQPKYVGSVSD
jgi:hypothetical protein